MIILTYLFILLGLLARFLPHLPNFSPVAALTLFSGFYLGRRYAFLLPLVILLVSDYFISGYYGGIMFYVYASYFLIGVLGTVLRSPKVFPRIVAGSLLSSFLFFVITNFGVWADPHFFYPRTLSGLVESYVAALPFFRNTLLGDLFFTSAFFGAYELSRRLLLKRVLAKAGAETLVS